jgi:hypothetical protein
MDSTTYKVRRAEGVAEPRASALDPLSLRERVRVRAKLPERLQSG